MQTDQEILLLYSQEHCILKFKGAYYGIKTAICFRLDFAALLDWQAYVQ